MKLSKALKALFFASGILGMVSIANAENRPKDEHILKVFVNGAVVKTEKTWDKELCDFYGRSAVDWSVHMIGRPYDVTPSDILSLSSTRYTCERA